MKRPAWRLGIVAMLMAAALHAQCGTEREPVKTGTDPDAGQINLGLVNVTSIALLRMLPAPRPLLQNNRIATPPAAPDRTR